MSQFKPRYLRELTEDEGGDELDPLMDYSFANLKCIALD